MKIQGKHQHSTPGSAGVDLFIKDLHIKGNEAKIHTGVRVEIPEGYVGLLFARSSLAKTGWILANSVGVIDSDYRGEIIVKLRFVGENYEMPFHLGDRVAQLVVVPMISPAIWQVGEIDRNTKRGEKGFGSTGK